MRILIDADAAPSILQLETLAKKYQIPCILIADDTHELTSDYSEIIIVSKGFQSVDMCLANKVEKNDIVITQDYGLAVLALAKKGYVVHPKGMVYTEQNIDYMLQTRHQNAKKMKQKKHLKGPKKRTKEDEERLLENVEKRIQECLR